MKETRISPVLITSAILGGIAFFVFTVLTGLSSDIALELRTPITQQTAAEAAVQFLQAEQHDSEIFDTTVTMQTHKALAGYLNKNQLMASYQQSYSETLSLDYFQVEAINPTNKEQYILQVHIYTGEVIGWQSVSAENAYNSDQMELVERYVERMGYDLEQFTQISTEPHALIFQRQTEPVGEANLQLQIRVSENGVSSFQPSFTIPLNYLEWQEQQDSSAARMSIISLALSAIMLIAALVYAIKHRGIVSFRRGIWLSILFFVISSAHYMNMYPALRSMFAGETAASVMTMMMIIFYLLTNLAMAVLVYLSLISGDTLWKQTGLSLWPKWNEASYGDQVLRAMGLGYLFCLIILGFQRFIFYIGEAYLDVWSVNDPLFSTYNLAMPILFPLMAWAAGISEEAIYRLFGIILFKKIVRNTFLAVLIPSMIWALGHTQYPIYPAYTRFVEVTILGIIFGYILLKHGFITAIFAHVSVNSILMGLNIMIVPGGLTHSLAGLLYIASPAIVAFLLYGLHRRFSRHPAAQT